MTKYKIPETVIRQSIDYSEFPDFEDSFINCDVDFSMLPVELVKQMFNKVDLTDLKNDLLNDNWLTFAMSWSDIKSKTLINTETDFVHVMYDGFGDLKIDDEIRELFDLDHIARVLTKIVLERC